MRAAQTLLKGGALRAEMAGNGRACAEKTFGIEPIADRFEGIIKGGGERTGAKTRRTRKPSGKNSSKKTSLGHDRPQGAAHRAVYMVKRRQLGHLWSKPRVPEFFVPQLFLLQGIDHRLAFTAAKSEFFAKLQGKRQKVDIAAGRQMPDIVKIAWFAPCPVGNCSNLLDGDFGEGVDPDHVRFRQIAVLWVSSKNRPECRLGHNFFINRDIHLYFLG